MKSKEEIRTFAECEFNKDLKKSYKQLGVDSYDEIFQEDRKLPPNKDNLIHLMTLNSENMKHANKRIFAFSAKMGLENQKTQKLIKENQIENQKIQNSIKNLTYVISGFMIFQIILTIISIIVD